MFFTQMSKKISPTSYKTNRKSDSPNRYYVSKLVTIFGRKFVNYENWKTLSRIMQTRKVNNVPHFKKSWQLAGQMA